MNYTTHNDLLAQVASSEDEILEVRRVLGACRSGLCAQGRKACPTPTACQVPEDDGLACARGAVNGLILSAALVIGALALVHFIL